MERNVLGHLRVLNETLSGVEGHFSSVEVNLERVRSLNISDLDGSLVVDLGHSLNFNEFNVVTLLIAVAFVLMYSDGGLLLVAD